MATAAVIGLCAVVGVAPPANAEPCEGAAAAAQPLPGQAFQIPSPSGISPFNRPIGHKPAGANDAAPLPKLGLLPALLKALTPPAAPVQQQAAVVPSPRPGGAATQQPPVVAQPAPAPAAAAVPSGPPGTSLVGWVTGPDSPNDTIKKFAITGTDLGIMWDNGDSANNQVLMAFGDTNGYCGIPGKQWRYNALFRSQDRSLAKTVAVPNGVVANKYSGSPVWRPGISKQIINTIGQAPQETGIIPTAGVAVGRNQYLNFMSIRSWDANGAWSTNYSAIAYSTDNGENWTVAPTSVRYNTPYGGNNNFQQGAFVRPGDGYVYSYGTPNGRQGAAYVSRVAEKDILDTSKYEYYSKGSAGGWFGIGATPAGWYKNNPAAATPVFGQDTGACGVANPGNQVSEMSVQWNKQLKKYVVLYGDQFNNIVMRTADTPQGNWSAAKVLMGQQSGGIYAPMMHPWSPSTMGAGTDLYWNLSLYSEYNVMLMKTDLTKV